MPRHSDYTCILRPLPIYARSQRQRANASRCRQLQRATCQSDTAGMLEPRQADLVADVATAEQHCQLTNQRSHIAWVLAGPPRSAADGRDRCSSRLRRRRFRRTTANASHRSTRCSSPGHVLLVEDEPVNAAGRAGLSRCARLQLCLGHQWVEAYALGHRALRPDSYGSEHAADGRIRGRTTDASARRIRAGADHRTQRP